jgi:hypothetical protein
MPPCSCTTPRPARAPPPHPATHSLPPQQPAPPCAPGSTARARARRQPQSNMREDDATATARADDSRPRLHGNWALPKPHTPPPPPHTSAARRHTAAPATRHNTPLWRPSWRACRPLRAWRSPPAGSAPACVCVWETCGPTAATHVGSCPQQQSRTSSRLRCLPRAAVAPQLRPGAMHAPPTAPARCLAPHGQACLQITCTPPCTTAAAAGGWFGRLPGRAGACVGIHQLLTHLGAHSACVGGTRLPAAAGASHRV